MGLLVAPLPAALLDLLLATNLALSVTILLTVLYAPRTTQLTGINPIGGYAISLEWADGHSHGIYTWHYLYALHQQQEAKKQGK